MCQADKFYVYALIDPINRIPFYVGKGCGHRAYKHLTGADTNNILKVKYVKNIRSLGFEPEVKFLATDLNESVAYNLESNFIKFIANRFLYFTNKIGVSKDAYCKINMNFNNTVLLKSRKSTRVYTPLSKEQKTKISEKLKGRKLTESHCKNIANYLTGKGFYLSKEELVELRQTLTIPEIANKFGISVTPIKKLIQKYKIYKYGLTTKVVM